MNINFMFYIKMYGGIDSQNILEENTLCFFLSIADTNVCGNKKYYVVYEIIADHSSSISTSV